MCFFLSLRFPSPCSTLHTAGPNTFFYVPISLLYRIKNEQKYTSKSQVSLSPRTITPITQASTINLYIFLQLLPAYTVRSTFMICSNHQKISPPIFRSITSAFHKSVTLFRWTAPALNQTFVPALLAISNRGLFVTMPLALHLERQSIIWRKREREPNKTHFFPSLHEFLSF